MAFHYQNLLLENDVTYPDFEKRYALLSRMVTVEMNFYKDFHRKWPTHAVEKINAANKIMRKENINKCFNRTEKLLMLTQIVMPSHEEFVDTLINKWQIDMEQCCALKDILNTLDRNDKDYLDGTIDALVNHHIPNWKLITTYYGLNQNEDIVLTKLLEIMYLHPEMIEKTNHKNK